MSFDFNKEGNQYQFLAGAERPDFIVLGKAATKYLDELNGLISQRHETGDDEEKRLMVSASGCLKKLDAFFLQSWRLAQRIPRILQRILEKPPMQPGTMIGLRDIKALTDFESLLFHGRALLDRLTFYLAKQNYNQDCDKFNKLRNVLANIGKKDERAQSALKIIDESLPSIRGLLIDSEDGKKSLRSTLIHKSTTVENTSCDFTIHALSGGGQIRFDSEIMQFPLMGSAWSLTKYVPFLTLNLLGIYLEHATTLPLYQCNPTWENPFVHFSGHIDPDRKGQIISLVKMHPSGFEIISEQHLQPDVVRLADNSQVSEKPKD